MSFYAEGDGYIQFEGALPADNFTKVESILSTVFNCEGVIFPTPANCRTFFSVTNEELREYEDEQVMSTLTKIASIAQISEGYISYTGEDGGQWRFIWEDGKWKEESGDVVYCDVPEKLSKMSRAFHMLVECLKAKQPDCADLCNEALAEFCTAENDILKSVRTKK